MKNLPGTVPADGADTTYQVFFENLIHCPHKVLFCRMWFFYFVCGNFYIIIKIKNQTENKNIVRSQNIKGIFFAEYIVLRKIFVEFYIKKGISQKDFRALVA